MGFGGKPHETRRGAKLQSRIKTGADAVRSLLDRDTYADTRTYDPVPCEALPPEYKVSSYSRKDCNKSPLRTFVTVLF